MDFLPESKRNLNKKVSPYLKKFWLVLRTKFSDRTILASNKNFQVLFEKYPKRLMAPRCLREVDFLVAMKRKFVNHLDWKKLGRTSRFLDLARAGTGQNISSFEPASRLILHGVVLNFV